MTSGSTVYLCWVHCTLSAPVVFFGKQVKKTSWCKFAFQHRWERKQRKNWSNASITTCCFRSRVIYLVPTCTVELHRACLKPHLIPDWGLKQRFEKSLSSPPKNGRKRSAIDDLRKVIGRQYVVIKCNKLCMTQILIALRLSRSNKG